MAMMTAEADMVDHLHGKRILITGGSSGFGLESAQIGRAHV